MPNKFSQPIQSGFVPTYAPMNIQAIAMGANQMQRKQEENMLATDTLLEEMSKFQVPEQDKYLLENTIDKTREALSQFEETGDFINARPAIRKMSAQFAENVRSGPLAKAHKNFQTMTENMKAIKEWKDVPEWMKQGMINQMLAGYEGVEKSGIIGEVALPEYVDGVAAAVKYAGEIEPQTYEEYGYIQETVGEGENKRNIWTDKKGTIKRVVRPLEIIDSIVRARLIGDPKYMEYIRAEAQIASPDNPEEYIKNKIDFAVATAKATKVKDDKTLAGISSGGDSWTSSDGLTSGVIENGGVVIDSSTLVTKDYNMFLDALGDAKANEKKEPYNFESKKGALYLHLVGIKKAKDADGKPVLTNDEMNYYIKTLEKSGYALPRQEGEYSYGNPNFEGVAEFIEDQKKGIDRRISSPNIATADEEFQRIHKKILEYTENKGDTLANSLILTDKTKRDHFRSLLAASINPQSFDIINQDISEEKKAKEIDKVAEAIGRGENPQILYTDNGVYYSVSYYDTDDEKSKHYILEEKRVPNQDYRNSGVTNYVAQNYIGGHKGKRLNTVFSLRNVNLYSGDNIYEKLPPSLRPRFDANSKPINYLRLDADNNGTYLYLGNDDDVEPYTYLNYIIDNAPSPTNGVSPLAFVNELKDINEKLNVFSQEDIRSISQAGGITEEMKKRMEEDLYELNEKYPFNDEIEAISYINP